MPDEDLLARAAHSLRAGTTRLTPRHVARYDWLRTNLMEVDVAQNLEFQRRFTGLFKLRFMPRADKAVYYSLMQRAKLAIDHDLAALLQEFHEETDRIELSFISKLIAIIDPNKAVWDSIVSGHLALHLTQPRTVDGAIAAFGLLCNRMLGMLENGGFVDLQEAYQTRFPHTDHAPMRILDASLWGMPPA